ncbi:polysaccharide biosynthesis tyrosine autokinase [Brachybacterium aquaticum]|uniref:non-specific protein-tyrosine kinase n=1 Tax=Brachybacterium aquaticum TaxID=1432564 RepID=A0A841AHA6_9MICO|nr:polysaccharide biosynthesis tyrosine autokinase [Brachybacterium aquaticum]MBB5832715.1 capsular exopolysaccharide synthesis family protein [Brachybacterium aquaticum]
MAAQRYLTILRERWVSMLFTILLVLGAAAGVTALQKPVYESSTSIFVLTDAGTSVADRSTAADYARQQISTYADLVATPLVLGPVVDELGLTVTPQQLAEDLAADVPEETLLITLTARAGSAAEAARIANAVAESLQARVQELESTNAPSAVSLTIVSPAVPANRPASPDPLQNAALGLMAALAAGVLVALLRDLLDNKVRKTDDIHLLTDASVLASVPMVRSSKPLSSLSDLDVMGLQGEAYRELRTNLRFLELQSSNHALMVTSSVKGEGKSMTSINLAAALARTGQQVLLIDADLRDPSVHKYLGIEGGAGLTTVLIGDATLEDVVQPLDLDGLTVLASGPMPPNPGELLDSEPMAALLAEATSRYDVVLLDTAPLTAAPDAAALARHVPATLFVVGSGVARRAQVSAALARLRMVEVRLLGIVLNGVPRSDHSTYSQVYGAPAQHAAAPQPSAHRAAAQADAVPPAAAAAAVAAPRGRRSRRAFPRGSDASSAERPGTSTGGPADASTMGPVEGSAGRRADDFSDTEELQVGGPRHSSGAGHHGP